MCTLLINHIEKNEGIGIANKYEFLSYWNRNYKSKVVIGDKTYFFHGLGCTVYSDNMPSIKWDFGYRSWWCGIEPYKMAETLESLKYTELNYYDGNFIKDKCMQYALEEILYYHKGQYYINMPKLQPLRINFPNNFDKLVVNYKGIKRSYPKNKNLDKFIRKSHTIYGDIGKLKNNYKLIFMNLGEVVAEIPYNDIAYPDSAVKIMNGEIIKPHIVELWMKEYMGLGDLGRL